MSHVFYAPGKKNPHLPHDGLELESPPPADAKDLETAERNADLLVSQLFLGDKVKSARTAKTVARGTANNSKPIKAKDLPEDVLVTPAPVNRAKLQKPSANASGKSAGLQTEETLKDAMRRPLPSLKENDGPSLFERFPPVYGVGVVAAGLLLMWPTVLLWVPLLCGVGIVALIALIKIPGVSLRLARRWQRFAARRPAKAERLRKVADRLALAFDRVLDMLPGSWADRLALPDFSQPVTQKR